MATGTIRKRGSPLILGRWLADTHAITVETDDAHLRAAVDSVLGTPQTIPVHAPERFEFAGPATPMERTPSTIQFLALFALELEARGFEVFPDDE